MKKGLEINFFSRSEDMWEAIDLEFDNIQASDFGANSEIIFPTPISKNRFISRRIDKKMVIQGRSLLSVEEMIQKYSQMIGLTDYNRIHYLNEEAEILETIKSGEYPELTKLVDSRENIYLKEIVSLLNQIERQIDIQFEEFVVSGNPIEKELQALREELVSKGTILRSAHYSLFARLAGESDIKDKDFLFLPPASWNYQTGGILKGLAKNNRVRLFLLGSRESEKNILDIFGLTQEYISDAGFKVLYHENLQTGEPQFFIGSDSAGTAVEVINNWLDEGVSPDKIVIADAYEDLSFFELSTALKIGLRGRKSIRANENYAAVLLDQILATRNRIDDVNKNLNQNHIGEDVFDNNFLELSDVEINRIKELFLLDDTQAINGLYHLLLDKTIDEGKILDINSFLWLDNLKSLINIHSDNDLSLEDYSKLIIDLTSQRFDYGDDYNIILTTYGEAASLEATHICFILQSDKNTSFALSSNELEQVYPELIFDQTSDQLNSLATSFSQTTFTAIPKALESNKFYRKHLKQMVPTKSSAGRTITRLEAEKISNLLNEIEYLDPPRGTSSISVTGYGDYKQCPIGWMIKESLELPAHTTNALKAMLGTEIHSLFERLKTESCSELLKGLETTDEVSRIKSLTEPLEYEKMIADISYALKSIEPLFESAENIIVEKNVSITLPVGEDEVQLKGKIDTILETPDGDILIDYKMNKPPKSDKAYQAKFYPTMEYYNQNPGDRNPILGFLYLGLGSRRADIYLNSDVDTKLFESIQNNFKTNITYKTWYSEKSWEELLAAPPKESKTILKPFEDLIQTVYSIKTKNLIDTKICDRDYCSHNIVNMIFRQGGQI